MLGGAADPPTGGTPNKTPEIDLNPKAAVLPGRI